ncbi:hypothetical protein CL1_0815 [Thermococcus cleftensis]|uniref:Uncharacterized protein n=1 Tax=Thermococcus cleftensis (strain DSM 27260 / KACC 17922 / CL1) TaxID=163003 RepID=I3ZTI6_THECF|nr:hypothetical protein [Thermococcus cleftensis]AFL95020.1 hypothetical protein CL1_0815 [Thermococcus cleftensis]
MDGWVRKVGALLLLAMLLSLQLGTVQETKALTASNSSVTFRRTVVAWYDENGKLQLNVTWVNKTIDFANLTNASCACHNSSFCSASNLTANFNVSVVTLYNMTRKHEQLLFFGITLYNETFNYTIYALVYKAERSQYNLSVITRIIPINGTNLFTTMVNIEPRDSKAQPVADIVFFANKTPLADHYRFVGKVLNEIRKNDTTSWIWNKVRIELNDLAKKTERGLGDYNIVGHGTVIIMDDTCTSSCGLICSLSTTPFCFLLCGIVAENPLCGITCSILWGGACGFGCSVACTGTTDLCSVGCGGFCAGLCSAACTKLGPFSFFCEEYACAPACTGACEVVCG